MVNFYHYQLYSHIVIRDRIYTARAGFYIGNENSRRKTITYYYTENVCSIKTMFVDYRFGHLLRIISQEMEKKTFLQFEMWNHEEKS